MLLVFFFLINLISGLFYFGEIIFQGWVYILIPLLSVVVISALIAYVEYNFILFFWKKIGSIVGYLLLFVITTVYTLLIVADSFLLLRFGRILGQETLFILTETNKRETMEFISTYSSTSFLAFVALLIVLMNYSAYKLCAIPIRSVYSRLFVFLALSGFTLLGYGSFSFARNGNSLSIPQYSVSSRCLYGFYSLNRIAQNNKNLALICRNLNCELPVETDTIPHIVVVIGESSSFYHCSVYDYEKNTWPYMKSRQEAGDLLAYNNVTIQYDATNWAMRSIFSYDSSNFGHTPILPAIFHSAGYHTYLIENQYFVGDGITFLCDQELSDAVFDTRHDGPFKYDGDILPFIEPQEELTLDIIHLVGQHYAYEERYPDTFQKFQADDYDANRYSYKQRQIIAHYDNSGLYCDYVLDQIIRKYEFQDCLLIFFPDHGEEVFETRDFCGHGSSATAPDASYLLHIPFFIWTSVSFKNNHTQLYRQLVTEMNSEFCTANFSKWLVKQAGILGV